MKTKIKLKFLPLLLALAACTTDREEVSPKQNDPEPQKKETVSSGASAKVMSNLPQVYWDEPNQIWWAIYGGITLYFDGPTCITPPGPCPVVPFCPPPPCNPIPEWTSPYFALVRVNFGGQEHYSFSGDMTNFTVTIPTGAYNNVWVTTAYYGDGMVRTRTRPITSITLGEDIVLNCKIVNVNGTYYVVERDYPVEGGGCGNC